MQEIAKHIYIETEYEEVNVGAIVTPTGVICIDAPSYARDARDWAARMHRLCAYPVTHIYMTDSHGDRIINTRWLNAPMIMQSDAAGLLKSYEKKYPQAILDSLLTRNPHRSRELSNTAVEHPIMNYSGTTTFYKHGDKIVLKTVPGPNPGSSWIILPEYHLIFCGDTLMVDRPPHLMAPNSEGWLVTLEELKEKSEEWRLIPGRGRSLATPELIQKSIDYLIAMRGRVQDHIDAELPFEKLENLIAEFVRLYPDDIRPKSWTKEKILSSLEFIHQELSPEPVEPEEEEVE